MTISNYYLIPPLPEGLEGLADRGITSELYGGGPELRLQQEIVLGIGGWKLLRALGVEAEVCHLNEGHAALAVLERARSFMEDTGNPSRPTRSSGTDRIERRSSMNKIALNGLGRIGRLVLRHYLAHPLRRRNDSGCNPRGESLERRALWKPAL